MKTINATPPVSPLMTAHETSHALGLSINQLRALRDTNTGPKFYRLDAHLVRYSTADVLQRAQQAAADDGSGTS